MQLETIQEQLKLLRRKYKNVEQELKNVNELVTMQREEKYPIDESFLNSNESYDMLISNFLFKW